ncbi:MAG: RNA polymerase-binding protein DksA [Panacagrimonas sp.]
MAQTKVKKKAAAAPKRPVSKAAPKKKVAAKPIAKKPVAKKAAPSKPVKTAKKAKPSAVVKKAPVKVKAAKSAKSAPKPATKPVARAKPAPKPAAKAKVAPATPVKPAAKRPLAVSHRPQAAAVSVQARPAAKPASARTRVQDLGTPGVPLTEDQIRRAPESTYMNDAQLAFFQERLLQMRAEVLTRELDVKERLHQREVFADPADRASAEEEHWLDLRLRERESLLLKKIDDALRRIRDREYGYCEKTGEAIGIARLLARPTATVCVDIKGQTERAESQYRDR